MKKIDKSIKPRKLKRNRTEKKKPIRKFRKNSGLVRFQFCNVETG